MFHLCSHYLPQYILSKRPVSLHSQWLGKGNYTFLSGGVYDFMMAQPKLVTGTVTVYIYKPKWK